MIDIMLTTEEAAKEAGVSRTTILRWIWLGYLGDVNKQNVTRGNGCGYRIRKSDLDSYIYGLKIDDPKTKPEEDDKYIVVSIKEYKEHSADKESLKLAASNLRLAIEFAREELDKIERFIS